MGTEARAGEPTGNARRVIHSSCQSHAGARGFCNLLMTKIDGRIVLDAHGCGACVIELDEGEATTMRDQLAAWLG